MTLREQPMNDQKTRYIVAVLLFLAGIHPRDADAQAKKMAAIKPLVSDCSPSAKALRKIAADTYASYQNQSPREFIAALDATVGVAPNATVLQRGVVVSHSDELSVIALFPYDTFRTSLLEALRKKEPIESGIVPLGVRIVVSPSRIDAPDIEKVVVERDGRVIAPLSSSLIPKELATRLGAKRMIHSGEVLFSCSAFAPGASVTVTAIPTFGDNLVKVITSETLATLK